MHQSYRGRIKKMKNLKKRKGRGMAENENEELVRERTGWKKEEKKRENRKR